MVLVSHKTLELVMMTESLGNTASSAPETDENTIPNPNQTISIKFREDDLGIVNNWVRYELFKKVKFVYEPEIDCVYNGALYRQFKKHCSTKLIGLKMDPDMRQSQKNLYLQSIWYDATQKKNNLIMDGLNARRSCIYSIMQNRFTGKAILVFLEALNCVV